MKTITTLAAAATLALGLLSVTASAQQPAPATKPAAPAAAAKPTPPPAATTTTPAKPAAAATTAKAPSPCKGLEKAACAANVACRWITPKKAAKDGKVRDPYCRLQPKKKAEPKKK